MEFHNLGWPTPRMLGLVTFHAIHVVCLLVILRILYYYLSFLMLLMGMGALVFVGRFLLLNWIGGLIIQGRTCHFVFDDEETRDLNANATQLGNGIYLGESEGYYTGEHVKKRRKKYKRRGFYTKLEELDREYNRKRRLLTKFAKHEFQHMEQDRLLGPYLTSLLSTVYDIYVWVRHGFRWNDKIAQKAYYNGWLERNARESEANILPEELRKLTSKIRRQKL